MGTFAGMLREQGSEIPEEKREEFEERLVKLFTAGGMMHTEVVAMYGKRLTMLRLPHMDRDGMDFIYNYFENTGWENAGYRKENDRVYSGKIGWSKFHKAIIAAYVLESLYRTGISAPDVDGDFFDTSRQVAWINYLFGEDFQPPKQDPWLVYEAMHDRHVKTRYCSEPNYLDTTCFITEDPSTVYGFLCAWVVQCGIDESIEKLGANRPKEGEKEDNITPPQAIGIYKATVRDYHKTSSLSEEEQIETIIDLVRLFYENVEMEPHDFVTECEKAGIEGIGIFLPIFGLPQTTLKAVAEVYGKDFWELWNPVRDIVENSTRRIANYEEYKKDHEPQKVPVMSTEKYMNVSPDDLIFLWDNSGNVQFSDEQWAWFGQLKEQFDKIMGRDEEIGDPKKVLWMIELAEFAAKEYSNVFVFTDFFEESVENVSDRRYLALWKLFEDILTEPEFLLMELNERYDAADKPLRRYLALVANKQLRQKVFSF